MVIAFMAALLPPQSLAQIPIKYDVVPQEPPDSVDLEEGEQKHFCIASAETMGFNLGLWAFDRYIRKGDYAHISLKSIKKNLTHGFKWDNDNLSDNIFLHPYYGNIYFNADRSNGYNFWQSSLFAAGGSLMWELFMENEYPSTNDIIATPIGGMVLGERAHLQCDGRPQPGLLCRNRHQRSAAHMAQTLSRHAAHLLLPPHQIP